MRQLPSIKRGISTTVHVGRISQFIQNWMLITQDPWVLQTVQVFQLPLVENPVQNHVPQEMNFSLDQERLVGEEVEKLI